MKRKSNYLQNLLISCLAHYVHQRIEEKKGALVPSVVRENMTHMAVTMLLMDHVKDDLFCLH